MQQYMINSIIVVSVSIFLIVVCSTLAAFSLVYFDFKRRKLILVLILAGFMIPAQIIFIPRYVMMSWLNLLDGRYSLILVYVASALAFSIFLIRQYFLNVPDSLSEAARLDGCSDFQIFYKIYLPIGKPALAAVVVYQFIRLWNEFLYAIAFVDTDSKRTLPAGLLQLQGTYGTNWGHVLAGVAIAVFPVVLFLILFRKQFIRGVNMRM